MAVPDEGPDEMLVAFTFDGTLSESDVYALLAEEAGVADEVAALANRARAGDLDPAKSVRRRADALEGLTEPSMKRAFDRVTLRPGAADLLGDLQDADHHLAVVTGAPERGVELAFADAGVGVDTLVAPRLDVQQNAVSGEVVGRLPDRSKGEALGELAVETGIGRDRTLAVGSDDTDRPLLEVAADSVCVSPEGNVDQHCEEVVPDLERLRTRLEARNVLDGAG